MCEPRSTFKKSCNTCVCNEEGSNAACTLQTCFEDSAGPVLHCVPLEKFKRYCNDCVCNEDGSNSTCTEKACDMEVEAGFSSRPVQKCTPHVTFQEDCNSCTCNAEGTFNICSTKKCGDEAEKKDEVTTPKSDEKCQPNETYKKDCNTCVCNVDGNMAMCTALDCGKSDDVKEEDKKDESSPPAFRCKALEVFKMDCNTCVCNQDGTNAACTEIGCVHYRNEAIAVTLTEKVESPPASVCVPLETIKKDCNTCFCNAEGTVLECTKIGCLHNILQDEPIKPTEQNEAIIKKEEETSATVTPAFSCKALESYKMGCNTCVCNEHGTNAACTQIDCQVAPVADVPKVTIEIEDEKATIIPSLESDALDTTSDTSKQGFLCKPGTHFMNDCNTCTCNEKGDEAVCTEIDCTVQKQN